MTRLFRLSGRRRRCAPRRTRSCPAWVSGSSCFFFFCRTGYKRKEPPYPEYGSGMLAGTRQQWSRTCRTSPLSSLCLILVETVRGGDRIAWKARYFQRGKTLAESTRDCSRGYLWTHPDAGTVGTARTLSLWECLVQTAQSIGADAVGRKGSGSLLDTAC